jgi:hypothetical protein
MNFSEPPRDVPRRHRGHEAQRSWSLDRMFALDSIIGGDTAPSRRGS